MQLANQKEDLSISYLSALCAMAGISYEIQRHDDDSTDAILKRTVPVQETMFFDAQLRIQLKCTSSHSQYRDAGEQIVYRLKVKNYNDLRRQGTCPIILAVLVLPEEKGQWIHWSREELLLRGCMYWKSFAVSEETENTSTVQVRIEKSCVLNVETLLKLMDKIAREEAL